MGREYNGVDASEKVEEPAGFIQKHELGHTLHLFEDA